MKNIKSYGLAFGLALLTATAFIAQPAKGQASRPKPYVVVFGAQQWYENQLPKNYVVYIVSRSQNSPVVKAGDDLAEACARLIEDGAEIEQLPALQFKATRR